MPKLLYYTIIFITLLCASLLGMMYCLLYQKSIDFSVLEQYHQGSPSIVLDDQGHEWARFQFDCREAVPLEKIPPHVIKAFLAAEDHTFFSHKGISWRGILRSIIVNLWRGRKAQGASTITQQLVRLLFFNAKKTYSRKIKEQIFALLVEFQFSKEQILEAYLNHVFFGCGIYGVQAACQRFWGKDVAQVTVDEAAVLAAIMRSPNKYCPLMYPLSAQQRRDIVLERMYKLGFITKQQYQEAVARSVVVQKNTSNQCAPHLKEMIRKKLLYTGGLVIQTTLNVAVQNLAQREFEKQIKQLRSGRLGNVDGALISIDVKTGGIKALIGGFDFATSKFN